MSTSAHPTFTPSAPSAASAAASWTMARYRRAAVQHIHCSGRREIMRPWLYLGGLGVTAGALAWVDRSASDIAKPGSASRAANRQCHSRVHHTEVGLALRDRGRLDRAGSSLDLFDLGSSFALPAGATRPTWRAHPVRPRRACTSRRICRSRPSAACTPGSLMSPAQHAYSSEVPQLARPSTVASDHSRLPDLTNDRQ
jgi:hypothetical protein